MKVSELCKTQDASNRWGQIRTKRQARKMKDALGSLKRASDDLKGLTQEIDNREDVVSLVSELRTLVDSLASSLSDIKKVEG
jgi:ABC-type transporter Mla subunit MlaD